jgi:hypothetical protein
MPAFFTFTVVSILKNVYRKRIWRVVSYLKDFAAATDFICPAVMVPVHGLSGREAEL